MKLCRKRGWEHEQPGECRRIPPLPPIDARCMTLGLTPIYYQHESQMADGAVFQQFGRFVIEKRARFAERLLHGPWDRVVRRRAAALEQKILQRETEMWFWGMRDTRYGMEIMDLRGQL